MNAALMTAWGAAACLLGGVSAAALAGMQAMRKRRAELKAAALGRKGDAKRGAAGLAGPREWPLRYAERLTRRLLIGVTEPLLPSVRAKRAGKTRAGKRYRSQAEQAGCAKDVTVSAYCEARLRLGACIAAAGTLIGFMLSAPLALLLGAAGLLVGASLPDRALVQAKRRRSVEAELHLSEMLEVVALGLRSGLTFDRSFALYGTHFDNGFARSCAKAYRSWTLGLCSRDEALRNLAASYDCDQLSRIVDSIIRSLRFGSALAGILEESGSQARAAYRASLEERVAKAPVKMMLPTGTLILPAMLLLVMGPVLLELAGGF